MHKSWFRACMLTVLAVVLMLVTGTVPSVQAGAGVVYIDDDGGDTAAGEDKDFASLGNMQIQSLSFANPDYRYVKLIDAGSDVHRSTGLSPQGDKFMTYRTYEDGGTKKEIWLYNLDGTGGTLLSPGDSQADDIYSHGNVVWSDDGSKVAWVESHYANPNRVLIYDLASGVTSVLYAPESPLDVANFDFIGASTTKIVFWAPNPDCSNFADLFIYDADSDQRTNITNSCDYKEYEPVSNLAGDTIVYWSGETVTETVDTTHILKYDNGTWTKDVGFTPIPNTYWGYYSGRSDEQILVSARDTRDLLVYNSDGSFAFDLTGPDYSGDGDEWNFFGSHSKGPRGEFLFGSNADNTASPRGRDVYLAIPLYAEVWVDDDWAGASLGQEVSSDVFFGFNAFAKIQDGIDGVSAGGKVNVAAGTYAEDLEIDRAVTLLGPNQSINPNTGTRVAEAVLYPATSYPRVRDDTETIMAYLDVSDITIKGFTFDGDNPALTSGVMIGDADVDARKILVSYEGIGDITVENNIFRNAAYGAMIFFNYYNDKAATSNNSIRYNFVEGIGEDETTFGIGVLLQNNFYADVTDNVFTGVRTSIQTGGFSKANPGTSASISNNTISTWHLGIFHNVWSADAGSFTISNNTISAELNLTADPDLNAEWRGIRLSSIHDAINPTISGNDIVIPDSVSEGIPGYAAGITVWNVTTSAPISISGGTMTGGDYGIFVSNYDSSYHDGSSTAVTIDGVTVQNSGVAGIYVEDSPDNTNGATVGATILNASISNSTVGVLVEGSDATAAGSYNQISGNTDGVSNTTGTQVNFSNNWWGAADGPSGVASGSGDTVSVDVLYCPWLSEAGGSPTGPVVNADTGEVFCTIQAAIDDVDTVDGHTINVASGLYHEQIVIDKSLTMTGVSSDTTVISGTVNFNAGATLRGFTAGTATEGAFISADGATIDDCYIRTTGPAPTVHTIQIYPGSGAANVVIKNSRIETQAAGKAAIYVETFGILDGFLLENNVIVGDYGVTQSFGAKNTTIRDNIFMGISGSTKRGIQLKTPLDNVLVEDNVVSGFGGAGIRLSHSLDPDGNGPVTIRENTLTGNENGVLVQDVIVPGTSLHFNRIVGNVVGVNNETGSALDAENNWWGCNAGPGEAGCDTVTGDVDADPWLVLGLTADPLTVLTQGGTAALAATLTKNCDCVDTASLGHVHDGIAATFGTTLGTVSPACPCTALGVAHATFTAGSVAGETTISATVDNQTVTMTLTVEQREFKVYLPFVTSNYVAAPDLVVEDVQVHGTDAQVVIRNQGNAAADTDFWVDLYVNPDPAPNGVNQTWAQLGDEGLVWGVTAPLAVGEAITLTTLNDPYYLPSESYLAGDIPADAALYVQVDSANTESAYGGVLEIHEIQSGAYNNVFGPAQAAAGSDFTRLWSKDGDCTDAVDGAVLPRRP